MGDPANSVPNRPFLELAIGSGGIEGPGWEVTCGSDGPTCSWLFRESQALDFSKRPLVQQFCWAGLQRDLATKT